MTDVTAYLCVDGASEALDFYTKAFGAEELYRLPMADGRLGHAEFVIGDTRLMIADEYSEVGNLGPAKRGGTSVSFSIDLPDVAALDAMWAAATGAGATVERDLEDQFYGYRTGTVVDPFGHRWSIMTKIEDVPPEELAKRAAAMEQ